jgi:fructose-1,6-bisphosphatase
MSLIKFHINCLESFLYQQLTVFEKYQIQEKGQSHRTRKEHYRPHSKLRDGHALSQTHITQMVLAST